MTNTNDMLDEIEEVLDWAERDVQECVKLASDEREKAEAEANVAVLARVRPLCHTAPALFRASRVALATMQEDVFSDCLSCEQEVALDAARRLLQRALDAAEATPHSNEASAEAERPNVLGILRRVADIIDATYDLDEYGNRTDLPGSYSGADVVEALCGLEADIDAVITAHAAAPDRLIDHAAQLLAEYLETGQGNPPEIESVIHELANLAMHVRAAAAAEGIQSNEAESAERRSACSKHEPDESKPEAVFNDASEDRHFVVNFRCKHCGRTGSAGITPSEISWG